LNDQPNAVEVNAKSDVTRGGCLTTFLVFMMIVNAALAVFYLLSSDAVAEQVPQLSQGVVLLLGAAALLNVILAVLVWQWRRAGVVGSVAVALVVFPLNIFVGLPILQSMAGLLGPMILAILVRPRWSRFR